MIGLPSDEVVLEKPFSRIKNELGWQEWKRGLTSSLSLHRRMANGSLQGHSTKNCLCGMQRRMKKSSSTGRVAGSSASISRRTRRDWSSERATASFGTLRLGPCHASHGLMNQLKWYSIVSAMFVDCGFSIMMGSPLLMACGGW